jgi:hypothetical protein
MKWVFKVISTLALLNLRFLSVAFYVITFADESMCLAHDRASAPFLTGIAPFSTFTK